MSSIGSYAKDFGSDLLAGGLSGMMSKTLTAPVERVKILLQTQNVNGQFAETKRYSGPINCLQRVIKEQGIWSLWRGNVANVIRYFPNQAINFAFKDKYRELFLSGAEGREKSVRMVLGSLAAGSAAGATSLSITYPLDMSRTRLAADIGGSSSVVNRQFTGLTHCLISMYKKNGLVKGLYSGFSVAVSGVVIFRGLYLGGYDVCKVMFDLQGKSIWHKYCVAQTLTTVVGTMCYPMDTIRRRMMMQAESASGAPLYRNGLHCARVIIRQEGGIRGLFPGLSANLVRGISGAALLLAYDEIKVVFQDARHT